MTPAEFEALFVEQTRVWFNWRRFREEQWPIALKVVTKRGPLGRLMTPHVRLYDDTTKDATHDQDEARGIDIRTAAATIHAMNAKSRAKILRVAADLSEETHGVTLIVPAYEYPGKRRMLMDGTHRLAALYLSGVADWSVAVFTVAVPQERPVAVDIEFSEART